MASLHCTLVEICPKTLAPSSLTSGCTSNSQSIVRFANPGSFLPCSLRYTQSSQGILFVHPTRNAFAICCDPNMLGMLRGLQPRVAAAKRLQAGSTFFFGLGPQAEISSGSSRGIYGIAVPIQELPVPVPRPLLPAAGPVARSTTPKPWIRDRAFGTSVQDSSLLFDKRPREDKGIATSDPYQPRAVSEASPSGDAHRPLLNRQGGDADIASSEELRPQLQPITAGDTLSFTKRYLPQSFDDIVGQGSSVRQMKGLVESRRVSSAITIFGPPGTGKLSAARLIAAGLSCEGGGQEHKPCGRCTQCRSILAGKSGSVKEWSRLGAKEVEEMGKGGAGAAAKVHIIRNHERLKEKAQWALEDLIKDGCDDALFIFLGSKDLEGSLAELSRRSFEFAKLAPDAIAQRLRQVAASEKLQVAQAALETIAAQAKGSMRRALVALEDLAFGASKEKEVSQEQVNEHFGLASAPFGLVPLASLVELLHDTVCLPPGDASRRVVERVERLQERGYAAGEVFDGVVKLTRTLGQKKQVSVGGGGDVTDAEKALASLAEVHRRLLGTSVRFHPFTDAKLTHEHLMAVLVTLERADAPSSPHAPSTPPATRTPGTGRRSPQEEAPHARSRAPPPSPPPPSTTSSSGGDSAALFEQQRALLDAHYYAEEDQAALPSDADGANRAAGREPSSSSGLRSSGSSATGTPSVFSGGAAETLAAGGEEEQQDATLGGDVGAGAYLAPSVPLSPPALADVPAEETDGSTSPSAASPAAAAPAEVAAAPRSKGQALAAGQGSVVAASSGIEEEGASAPADEEGEKVEEVVEGFGASAEGLSAEELEAIKKRVYDCEAIKFKTVKSLFLKAKLTRLSDVEAVLELPGGNVESAEKKSFQTQVTQAFLEVLGTTVKLVIRPSPAKEVAEKAPKRTATSQSRSRAAAAAKPANKSSSVDGTSSAEEEEEAGAFDALAAGGLAQAELAAAGALEENDSDGSEQGGEAAAEGGGGVPGSQNGGLARKRAAGSSSSRAGAEGGQVEDTSARKRSLTGQASSSSSAQQHSQDDLPPAAGLPKKAKASGWREESQKLKESVRGRSTSSESGQPAAEEARGGASDGASGFDHTIAYEVKGLGDFTLDGPGGNSGNSGNRSKSPQRSQRDRRQDTFSAPKRGVTRMRRLEMIAAAFKGKLYM
eukprot:jgi/Mesen1/731/ME000011S00068